MNLITILQNNTTGNPVEDVIILGILFTIFWSFYNVLFETVFSIFKK